MEKKKGVQEWLIDVGLRLVAPRLVAGVLLGVVTALVAAGLLAPDVGQCLAGALGR